MPTTLPERRQPYSPSLRFILALGAAFVLMVGLVAFHARFKAWVADTLRAELVVPGALVASPPASRIVTS
jgi:hypothetical protein